VSKTVTAEGETFGSAGGFNVIVAVEEPIALDAVTVSVPDAGIVAGAVYKPEEVTAPTPAVQVVAPGALNCWVPERATDTDEGETTGAEPIGTVMVFPKADKEFLAENVVLVALAGWYTDDVIVVGVTVPVDNCTPPSDTSTPGRNPVPVIVMLTVPLGSGFGVTEVIVGPAISRVIA
jgi:hypothetical protein